MPEGQPSSSGKAKFALYWETPGTNRPVSRGHFSHRGRSDCDDPITATAWNFKEHWGPRLRFARHPGIYRPMWGKPKPGRERQPPACHSNPSPRTRREERVLHRLDEFRPVIPRRVARQHCPSPLHRHGQTTTGFLDGLRNRTFLLCWE